MIGDRLHAEVGTDRFETVRMPRIDAQAAAARTLKAYLERLVFEVEPGQDGLPIRFNLEQVLDSWPQNFVELKYPSASISSAVENHAYGFVPSMMEETFGKFGPETVLWKTSELNVDFGVDFWCNDAPTCDAIAGSLDGYFNPGEGRSGIIVEGPEEFFSMPVRFTLGDPQRFQETGPRELRFKAQIHADLDVVHLRRAVKMVPRIFLGASGEVDPPACT